MDKKSKYEKTKIGYLNKIAEDFKTDLTEKVVKKGTWHMIILPFDPCPKSFGSVQNF